MQQLLPLRMDLAVVAWTGGERQLAGFCCQKPTLLTQLCLPAAHRKPGLLVFLFLHPGVFSLVRFQKHLFSISFFFCLPNTQRVADFFTFRLYSFNSCSFPSSSDVSQSLHQSNSSNSDYTYLSGFRPSFFSFLRFKSLSRPKTTEKGVCVLCIHVYMCDHVYIYT